MTCKNVLLLHSPILCKLSINNIKIILLLCIIMDNIKNIPEKYKKLCKLEYSFIDTCNEKYNQENKHICDLYEKLYIDCVKFKQKKES